MRIEAIEEKSGLILAVEDLGQPAKANVDDGDGGTDGTDGTDGADGKDGADSDGDDSDTDE